MQCCDDLYTEPHAFLLEPLIMSGVKVVTALHSTLLPVYQKPTRGETLAANLSKHFYTKSCSAILSHPGSCAEQVIELTAGQQQPIVEFLPHYSPEAFKNVKPPAPARKGISFA